MPVDRGFVIDRLRKLISIDSRNPCLEGGAPGEWELARYVEEQLASLEGWRVDFHDLGERRANVIGVRTGTADGPSLMINVHLDTVGVAGMRDPFSGAMRDGKVFGRGAQDTKGGMAAVLGVARALAEDGATLAGDLVLAFVADEEHESIGTTDLVDRIRPDAAIVIEPSDLDVCIAHRGFGVFRLRTKGRAAHGGRSDLGVDANLHMGLVLAELDGLRAGWGSKDGHPRLGSASLHVPLLRGGRGLYAYADECVADVECRTVPGQTVDGVLGELRATLSRLAESVPDFASTVEPILWRSPYEIDPGRPIVRAALEAAERVRGEPAALIAHPWWEDSGLLGDAGIDTVIIGPRGDGLHTDEEWVDADSVVVLAEILLRTVGTYCVLRKLTNDERAEA
ncbi:MAG: M20/M25/M40 family metallo-hydrolase [Gemmatimonadota bacterium]